MYKTAMRAAAALIAVLMLLGISGVGGFAADTSEKIDPQLAGMLETAEDGDVFHIDIDSMTETQPDASLAGDLDGDGFVHTGDARAILRHAASVEKLCTLRELAIADLTGDGSVRTDDARRALRIAAGLETGETVRFPEMKNLSSLQTGTVTGNNLYDLSEPRELVAGMSYVFAAKVLRAVDYQTEFNKDATPADLADIRDEAMTYLEIEVVENLKGNLLKNTKIPFFKGGGVTADGKYIELFEHDLIPEEGKYYVFTAYARQNGSLIGGCEYGCAALEEDITGENLDSSEVIRRFRAACASPAPIFADSQYLHYLARWDADFVSAADNLERSMEIREPDEAAIAAYQAEKRAKHEQPSEGGTEPPPPTEPFGA